MTLGACKQLRTLKNNLFECSLASYYKNNVLFLLWMNDTPSNHPTERPYLKNNI